MHEPGAPVPTARTRRISVVTHSTSYRSRTPRTQGGNFMCLGRVTSLRISQLTQESCLTYTWTAYFESRDCSWVSSENKLNQTSVVAMSEPDEYREISCSCVGLHAWLSRCHPLGIGNRKMAPSCLVVRPGSGLVELLTRRTLNGSDVPRGLM